MARYQGDGYREAAFAVILLWAGVALGVINIGLRVYLIQLPGHQIEAAAISPLAIAALVFIFVQARLIMRLAARNGAVRSRILFLTILRFAIVLPAFSQAIALSAALVVIPTIAAILQLLAILLVFTAPGRNWFSAPRQGNNAPAPQPLPPP